MTRTRRKSALMSTILGMEGENAFNEDAPIELDELDEQMPEELSAEDLSFLDEVPEDVEADDDAELNVDDIVNCADENGMVRMSSIRALAECTLPDDKDEDEIYSSIDELEDQITASLRRKADINRPGIEDTIGNEAHGGTPSVSEVVPGGDDVKLNENDQQEAIKGIVARIDHIANYCQRAGYKRLAYNLDIISDKLESL